MSSNMETILDPLGYSIQQACKVIPCSRSFLYRQMKAGHIRSTKHGRKVLISRQAIQEFLGEATPAIDCVPSEW